MQRACRSQVHSDVRAATEFPAHGLGWHKVPLLDQALFQHLTVSGVFASRGMMRCCSRYMLRVATSTAGMRRQTFAYEYLPDGAIVFCPAETGRRACSGSMSAQVSRCLVDRAHRIRHFCLCAAQAYSCARPYVRQRRRNMCSRSRRRTKPQVSRLAPRHIVERRANTA